MLEVLLNIACNNNIEVTKVLVFVELLNYFKTDYINLFLLIGLFHFDFIILSTFLLNITVLTYFN